MQTTSLPFKNTWFILFLVSLILVKYHKKYLNNTNDFVHLFPYKNTNL